MAKDDERPNVVVYEGTSKTITYAINRNGSMPAKEFIEGLSRDDKRKLLVLFHRMGDTGRIANQQQFKKERDAIWAFKRFQIRIGCFQDGDCWVLTHGFIKKSNSWPRSELDRADRLREEHLAWKKKGRNA